MTEQVPVEAQEQIRAAVDTALASPAQAQGFLSNIPDLSGVKGKVGGALDTGIGALNTLLQYKWLIPDQYEAPLQKLLDALTKVKGWIG
jgi:hypothetical protein